MKYTFLFFAITFITISCNNKKTLFQEVSSSVSNVEFANNLSESLDFNVLKYGYFYNGGGVATGDFNNDGLMDLYFTANLASNKLYVNKGDFQFEDVTEKSGLACQDGWNTGVSLVDINSDGWLDIYVCRSAAESFKLRQNQLFINNHDLTFTEKAAEYGLNDAGYSTQAAFFDYDKDGDLDVFLLNHSIQKYAGFSKLLSQQKKEEDANFSSKLMRNDNGMFVDVSKQTGIISNVLSFGLGIATSDFNNDGWLDMYISNDYNEEDYLYINQKDGTFKETIRESIGHTSLFSMGSDAADVNNDGWMDLMTLDMQPESNERIKMTSGDDNYDKYKLLTNSGFHHQSMRNMLQLNQGFQTANSPLLFSEIGQLSGISNTDWSWSTLFGDYDLDGYKDVFITNGYARDYTNMEFLKYTMDEQIKAQETGKEPDMMEVIKQMPSIKEANYIYRNNKNANGSTLRFENKQIDWGLDEKMMSNGAVQVDLDNDGDLDLVVNNINEKAKIYKNEANILLKNNYLRVHLLAKNSALIHGAKVLIYAQNTVQVQEFSSVRGFQSSTYAPLIFGFDQINKVDSLQVIWQNGLYETLKNVQVNTTLKLNAANAKSKFEYRIKGAKPLFSENFQLDFTHKEDDLNDFKLQPLLPQMQSYSGPRIAKGDVNKDGKEDFYICGARGQAGGLFLGNKTSFSKINQFVFEGDAKYEDADATFFDADDDKDLDLLVASTGYDLPENSELLRPRLYLNNGKGQFSKGNFTTVFINASCVRIFDVNNDNKLDIFIGAKSNFMKYPLATNSHLFLSDGKGNFMESHDKVFKNIGSISDAVAFDYDKNNSTDLLLTDEFGSPILLKNNRGIFQKVTSGISNGLWNRALTSDFDNDGDEDLVIGNMGLNYQPVKNTDGNLTMLAGDFSNTGRIIPLLCVKKNGKTYPFTARDETLDQLPELKKKYTDYKLYSTATIEDILSVYQIKNVVKMEASEFETLYFENVNGHFIKKKLPIEAQFSPIFAIAALDINNDGYKDLILGGNMDKTRVRIGKMDANYGQIFLNNKKGNFNYHSNLGIKGDVRDMKVVNNQLVVGINGEKVRIFSLN